MPRPTLLPVILCLAALPLLAQQPPPGGTAHVRTTRPAKLQLVRGGAVELKPGTELEFLGLNPATGVARVRFRQLDGTVPIPAIGQETPPAPSLPTDAAATAAPSAPPPLPLPAGATARPLTAAEIAQLPPEAQAFLREAQAAATSAAGTPPADRTFTTSTSTDWQKSSGPTPPPAPPPGATVTVTKSSLPAQRTTLPATATKTERRFRTKEEAERYLAATHQAGADEARARAEAEALARAAAAQATPPPAPK